MSLGLQPLLHLFTCSLLHWKNPNRDNSRASKLSNAEASFKNEPITGQNGTYFISSKYDWQSMRNVVRFWQDRTSLSSSLLNSAVSEF